MNHEINYYELYNELSNRRFEYMEIIDSSGDVNCGILIRIFRSDNHQFLILDKFSSKRLVGKNDEILNKSFCFLHHKIDFKDIIKVVVFKGKRKIITDPGDGTISEIKNNISKGILK